MKKYIIRNLIWLALAVVCLIIAIVVLNNGLTKENNTFFIAPWLICAIPIIPVVWRMAKFGGRSGFVDGANTYDVTVTDTTVTAQNHPFKEAVIQFIMFTIIGIILAPVILVVKMLMCIINLIKCAVSSKKDTKNYSQQ